jgi:hypothetical protein
MPTFDLYATFYCLFDMHICCPWDLHNFSRISVSHVPEVDVDVDMTQGMFKQSRLLDKSI